MSYKHTTVMGRALLSLEKCYPLRDPSYQNVMLGYECRRVGCLSDLSTSLFLSISPWFWVCHEYGSELTLLGEV